MKFLIILFLVPSLTYAAGLSNCGEYTIKGVVRPLKDGLALVVNENTKSEMIIKMAIHEQSVLGGYLDRTVMVKALLTKKFDGTNGYTEKIIKAEFRLPNPLNPKDTGLTLQKKTNCKENLS